MEMTTRAPCVRSHRSRLALSVHEHGCPSPPEPFGASLALDRVRLEVEILRIRLEPGEDFLALERSIGADRARRSFSIVSRMTSSPPGLGDHDPVTH
jgi:hypothetical protein